MLNLRRRQTRTRKGRKKQRQFDDISSDIEDIMESVGIGPGADPLPAQ